MDPTYKEAKRLAQSALRWALARLTADPRAMVAAEKEPKPLPLHVLLRNLLLHVEEHGERALRETDGANAGGSDESSLDHVLDADKRRKVAAVLEFGYARALDVAQIDSSFGFEGSLEEFRVSPAFEPELQARAARALDALIPILRSAAETLPPIQELVAAYKRHLGNGTEVGEVATWVARQSDLWLALVKEVSGLEATALALRVATTFDEERRSSSPHTPLTGLSRREQQRLLGQDALFLHEKAGLSEADVGELWAGSAIDRDEAKKLGGDVLRRVRKARAEGAREK